eukprot:CAMPEP_0201618734 /NCGR_PEP_ID=MMETSP0492-20130828/39805_1 /ASSEMBLY_ACC=CAM_ASM_000837 /TAXON_ID=420259 /ORGANISM="Thalassiosira gravida, Strain GMp14c1" /LENGTH=181 /DNA_ID=CAMNT_0048087407 /DNA_START=29 /DNA_END=571 /DNA_ORIENTATION=-
MTTTNLPFSTPPSTAATIVPNFTNKSVHHYSFSTSPDYTNYETWHRDNYEEDTVAAVGSNGRTTDAAFHSLNTIRNFHPSNEVPRMSVLMELKDGVGALHDVLRFFWKYDVNISRIESRPVSNNNNDGIPKFDFFVDFYGKVGSDNVDSLLRELKRMTDKLLVLDEKEVSGVVYVCIYKMW